MFLLRSGYLEGFSSEASAEAAKPSELDQAKADLAKEHDNYLRLAAEYDNFRKRSQKEKDNLYTEIKAETSEEHKARHLIGLPQAVGTIMVMDLVFSIDSVITAVGLAEHLIVMILAVMIAVFIMMIFIDPISNFINSHPEMKILALVFICAIGVLLVLDSAGIHTSIEVLDMHMEKLMVYFAMIFAVVLEFIQMAFNSRLNAWKKQLADEAIDAAVREAEGGEEPAKVGEQARARVDAAIENAERID